jgi:arginyl-tRNA synthetase
MVRYNTNSLIVFDFNEALSLQGNTGPYLQYAHARAANILRKTPTDVHDWSGMVPETLIPAEKDLLRKLAEYPLIIRRGFTEVAPSVVTDYAYSLATSFMGFYENAPVIAAQGDSRAFRIQMVKAFQEVMANTLYVLGIPAPERM